MSIARFLLVLAGFAIASIGTLWFLERQIESGRWPAPQAAMISLVANLAVSLGLVLWMVHRRRRRGARS